MKIINNTNNVKLIKFKDIEDGKMFRYDNKIYIKAKYEEGTEAVCIDDNWILCYFNACTEIEVVDYNINITNFLNRKYTEMYTINPGDIYISESQFFVKLDCHTPELVLNLDRFLIVQPTLRGYHKTVEAELVINS